MSVTGVVKDTENLTMTLTAEYDVNAERAWQLFADPRQLERWWGPPTFPATMVDHDLAAPGGVVTYYMTSPAGEKFHGWWRVREVRAPHLLVIEDGFGESPDSAAPGMPLTVMRVDITDRPSGGVVLTIGSTFPSAEAMQQLLEMGMDEGMTLAVGQIDGILAEGPNV